MPEDSTSLTYFIQSGYGSFIVLHTFHTTPPHSVYVTPTSLDSPSVPGSSVLLLQSGYGKNTTLFSMNNNVTISIQEIQTIWQSY